MDTGFIYYRADYDYAPDGDDAGNYLVIQCGDTLEVPSPGESHGGWLKGRNKRTNLEGYFPESYVSKVSPVPKVKPRIVCHRFDVIYFLKPVLCACCKDYIWGTGIVGKVCEGCGICVHNDCEPFATSILGPCSSKPAATPPETHSSEVPLSNWTTQNVIEWLAVVGLHRYVHIFRQHKVDGQKLQTLDLAGLRSLQIVDEFHQQALLAAIGMLCSPTTALPTNGSHPDFEVLQGNCSESDHKFYETSFSVLQRCHLCGHILLGVLRQGYRCQKCGLCCHRRCHVGNSLPDCDVELLKKVPGFNLPEYGTFHMPLECQFDPSDETPAPPLVVHCVTFLENATGVKLLDEYRRSCPTEEIDKLRHLLCEAPDCDIISTISKCTPAIVAGLLKRNLRELPDSVIPQQSYVDFIIASQLSDDAECDAAICGLVQSLPKAHLSTLRYLIIHLRHVCSHQYGPRDPRNPVKLISDVFYEILLRPPWSNIIDFNHNVENHLRIVSLLITGSLWPEHSPPSSRAAVQHPTSPDSELPEVHPRVPSPPGIDECKLGRLEDAAWYWSSTSKEEVNRMLSDMPDGTFLVRDATDKTANQICTLTIRKGGANRLVRIYQRDGMCGFAEPYQFPSVVELIHYYRTHSLSEYNPALDTVLLRPISRFPDIKSKMRTVDSLRHEYVATHRQCMALSDELDALSEKHTQIMQTIQMKQHALSAFDETIAVFVEHLKIAENNHRNAMPLELQKVRDNTELLKRRSQIIVDNRNKLESDLHGDSDISRKILASINDKKPELKRLTKLRDDLKKQLLDCGETNMSLDNLLKESDPEIQPAPVNVDEQLLPLKFYEDEHMWYNECNRAEAEKLLYGQTEGTFLIRPKDSITYVLSIVKPNAFDSAGNLQIAHCLIKKQDTGYLGFAEPYFIHHTLKDLVLHYREESLFQHNDELDTTLRRPFRIGAQQLNTISQQQGDSQNYVMVNIPPRPTRHR